MPYHFNAFGLSSISVALNNTLKTLLPIAFLMTASPAFGAGLSIQYELIARTDVTPVPDGVGTIAGFSSYPAIDNSGNIVFTAHGGPDNNGNDFQSGIYTFINGQFQTVADTYTPVPGGNGATFNYFPTGMQNDIDDGRVAFTASLDALGTQLGLYSNVGQATKYELVEIATNDGIEWEFFRQPWVDGDVVATTGKRLIPDRHTTVLRWNGSDLSKNFVDPGAGYGSCNPTEISISSDATFFCRYKTDATEYVISTGSGYETLVELNTTPIPGHAGETFGLVRDSLVVDQGGQDAAFVGVRNSGSGLYKRIDGGALEQVVDDVTLVPGSSGSFDFFYSFDQDRISLANGHMLFWAAGPSFLEGLYTDIDGELSVIVDDQDNGAIELDGQMEQITRIDMSRKSFAYTPQGYMVVFRANLQSGGTAIVRATINTDTTGTVPNISVSGNTTFGNVNIGTSSTHTVTISNTGNANLVIGNLYGLSAPFSIVSNNCSGSTVTPAASCTVGVRFAPTTTGTRSDTLVIPSNDPDQASVNFSVNGTGTSVSSAPDITVSGNGAFGNVPIGSSGTRSITVSNVGNANLVINSLFGLAAPFSIIGDNCSGKTLSPSISCEISVSFAATEEVMQSDVLFISSNDPDQPYSTFSFNGTGTSVSSAPNISVSGSSAFGNVAIGTSSTHTVTISNTGNANLVIGNLNGLSTPFSTVSNNCSGSTVAPAASCTVGVRFAPTTTGTRSDTLIIPSNDPDQATVNINVSGTGKDSSRNELRNIATRAEVREGNEILNGGFVIIGETQKCVIVQGLGQSVDVPEGVTRLADPTLELKSGLTSIAKNDNWQDQTNPSDVQLIENSGRAPEDILEAAIYKCLDPGAYTVLVTGYNSTTGIGMVAIYDADDGSSYLKNISTRSWVGTDHAISIAGFVVTGDAPKQVLVRGLGPSMESKFPPDSPLLRDPQLRLYQGANLIETNDDWGDATNAAAIGALPAPLQPTHNKEPAILMTLEPGLYTAHLLGVDGTTGIANVAVYDLTGR